MDERLYRVTVNDQVDGPVERERAHEKDVLHRSGVVFLRRGNGTILIHRRSPGKTIFPDRYDGSAAFMSRSAKPTKRQR